MADHEIRPGDTLHIIWPMEQQTPFGKQTIESKFSFSYNDLLNQLTAKNRSTLAKSPESEAIRASRSICITSQALIAGKWSTGAPVNASQTASRMVKKLSSMPSEVRQNLSENALNSLNLLIKSEVQLNTDEVSTIKEILENLPQT